MIDDATSQENSPNTSSIEQGAQRETEVGEGSCPVCKDLRYLRSNVPVGHPDFGRLIPCACHLSELGARRVAALRAMSELDILSRFTFDAFAPEGHGLSPDKQANLRWAFEEARSFAGQPRGWLILKGGYGCGKTHLAAAIANACVENGQAVLMKTVPDLLDHLRAAFGPTNPSGFDTEFVKVRTAPVLILDDLGTESSTSWAREKLFQILNHRYATRLPTVITTNHELEDIPLRLRSRLADPDLTKIVSITAPDFRRAGVSEEKSELSSLGLHRHQTFDTFDLRTGELPPDEEENLRNAFEIARGFAETPSGWLVFTGTYGCGKTHLAASAANYLTERGHTALFVVIPDLLDHLRATYNPHSTVTFDQRFEEVRRAQILVLDDLGTESATPWAREKLYQIFDYRYNALLPTIITTSTPIEELEPRLATRMVDVSRCTPYVILVPAYRGDAPRRKAARRSRERRSRR